MTGLRPIGLARAWSITLAAVAAACADAPTRPVATGHVSLQPVFARNVDLDAVSLAIESVRVRISGDSGVVVDSVIVFPQDQDQVTLDLEVPLQTTEETIDVLLELRAGTETLFRGGQSVVLRHGAPNGVEPIEIPLQYVGPGANVAGLAISPRRPFVILGETLQFTVTAVDSQLAPVAAFYVGWVTSDATIASIGAGGLLRTASTIGGTVWVRARTPTGIADSVTVMVTAGGEGRIVGTLRDAATGGVVAGATVDVRAGPDATISDPPVRSTVSGSDGSFALDALSPGAYTLFAQHAAYLAARVPNIAVAPGEDVSLSVPLSPPLAPGQTRIVLSWGALPNDLDTYLEVPDTSGGAPFVVYYSNRGDAQAYPFSQLDVDVTSGFGPETITIYQQLAGTYVYHVHDFTTYQDAASTVLAGSAARVEVYQNNQLVQTFSVPNQPGTLWTVFQLSGTTITPINQVAGDLPPVGGGAQTGSASVGVRHWKSPASR